MNASVALAPSETARHRSAPPGASSALTGFFTYHGVWAPGVRLFRSLAFRWKAVIISGLFSVPIAVLAWSFLQAKSDAIGFSAKERDGVVYLREALPLLPLAEQQRLESAAGKGGTSADAPRLQAALAERMKKLEAVETRLGTDLGTAKAHAAVKSAPPAAARRPTRSSR